MTPPQESWAIEKQNWPHSEHSQFVNAGALTFHVQTMGTGKDMLLLHGTGASTHSFRHLAPLLAQNYRVIMPDLPGHGFTDRPPNADLSLPAVADSLSALLRELDANPTVAIGHSAGAAILVQMSLSEMIEVEAIFSINGAILPFRGAPNFLFPALAKLLFLNPLTPRLFAARQTRQSVKKLLTGTGSSIEDDGIDLYLQLIRNPSHVAGALGMMANWKLEPLVDQIKNLRTPLYLIAAERDKAVRPEDAQKLCYLCPKAKYLGLDNLGHLAHEEAPEQLAELFLSTLAANS